MEQIEPNIDGFKYYCSRFKNKFSFNERLTPWNCPHCNIGKLIAKEENFICRETLILHPELEPTLQYSGFFICNCCDNKTFSTGTGIENHYCGGDYEAGDYSEISVIEYTPQFFSHPVMLFKPPVNTPSKLVDALKRVFSLCWNDIPASCNAIRVMVEMVLKEKWPDATGSNLNRKIEKLQKDESDNSANLDVLAHLLALKWLGNSGSHDDQLEERDLAVAFAIIEEVLLLLYPKTKHVKSFVNMVNTAKGRPIKS